MGLNLVLPANTGHEVGGVVAEIGRDVRTVKVGDRVTIPFHESDGTCPQCRAGYQNVCDKLIMAGVQRLGGWAQYVTVTAADLNCIQLPDGVDTLSAAALGCRFMTAYRAVTGQGRVQPCQWAVRCTAAAAWVSRLCRSRRRPTPSWLPSTLKIENSPRPAKKVLWRRSTPAASHRSRSGKP
jgi:D-arabinose 1-dehydrogenase-like Zn-dependent alcohol dehydrogenase